MLVVTLDQLKTYLGINDAGGSVALTTWNEDSGDAAYNNVEQDALLQILLDGAISFVDKYCGRAFWANSYTELINGNAQQTILLKNWPVNSLTSIEYNSGTNSTPVRETVDPDNYWLSDDAGIVNLDFYLNRWFRNYKVVYNAGTSPKDLIVAVLKIAWGAYNKRWADGVKSETVSWDRIEYAVDNIDPEIILTLDLYKNAIVI